MDLITSLKPNEILVFPSNLGGRHGKGGAKYAKNNFGAKEGIGVGFTGRCYAIPTKDAKLNVLPLSVIEKYVRGFIRDAELHPRFTFLVTPIGTGLAGYSVAEMAPLFYDCLMEPNIKLPPEFLEQLSTSTTKKPLPN